MRNTVKSIAIALLASVLLVACGSKEPERFDVDLTFESDKLDLEGAKIKYVYALKAGRETIDSSLGYENGTLLGELALKRLKDIQNDLNCTLDIEYMTTSVADPMFIATSASGTYMCDAMVGISDMLRAPAKIGMLMGMTELEEYIDFRNEEKWGRRNILEVIYWQDDCYGLIPLMWPSVSVSYDTLPVINEDLISSLGVSDPRDLYENKQWTWETFRGCLEKYYMAEGSEVKNYALTCSTHGLGSLYLISNGYRLAELDKNGEFQSGLYNPRTLVSMEEAKYIYDGPLAYTLDTQSNSLDSFLAGNTVISVISSENVTNRVAKETTNFGLVPWPSGPDVAPGFKSACHANIERCLVFSRLSHCPEQTAAAISALYEPFEEYPTVESIREFMSRNYFFDSRDTDVYFDLYWNSQYTYFATSSWAALGEWLQGNKSPSEYIESVSKKVDEHVEENIEPSKRGILAVWGEE
jgi:ABC-type glycerol-3-phosphate transport system substrate-binding protein